MNEHDLSADDTLLGELKDALAAADSIPEDVARAAKESFTWRTIDAELAELVFDSALEQVPGVRGEASGERQLTFRSGEREIEVLIAGNRVTGQLVPPQQASVELIAGDTVRTADADDSGTFSFAGVPTGPASLRVRVGETTITTEWTVL